MTPTLMLLVVISGIFCFAATRILIQHSFVKKTIELAIADEIQLRAPKHDFEINFERVHSLNTWLFAFWHPLSLLSGCSLLWIFAITSEPNISMSFEFIVLSVIGLSTIIVRGLFSSFPPLWLLGWNIDLQLISIKLNIEQLTKKLEQISSDPLLPDSVRNFEVGTVSSIVNELQTLKTSLEKQKQQINEYIRNHPHNKNN